MSSIASDTTTWKRVGYYVKDSVSEDHLTIVAPGVAFYLMLGLIPGIAALISIYGLVADPEQVQEHFQAIAGGMPEEARTLLSEQMERIAGDTTSAGLGAIVGIALALWSGSQAVSAFMEGLNITYNRDETRGTVKRIAVRLALTLMALVLGLLAIGVLVVMPPLLNALPLGDTGTALLSLARWPLLLLVGIFGLALLYRYAPDRGDDASFRWITWGSAIAAVLWVAGSALFSLYVSNFGEYNETYGALGAVVILLLWLLITAFVFLLGAEVDAALEQEDHARTTD
jgi:membrane protein